MVHALSSQSASEIYDSSLGLVFTDAKGRIVFADNKFLTLVGNTEAHQLVGEPLAKIVRVAQEAIGDLIQAVAHEGYVHQLPLVITRDDGQTFPTVCTGVASYDDRQTFIGVDLTLRDPGEASPVQSATHHDVLGARIQQIEAEADAHAAQDEVLAQLYFTAQVSALQVLLGRLAGPRIVETVEEIVNQGAADNHWPIQMKGGHFLISTSHVPAAGYRALFQAVIEYGRNVVGSKVLTGEMRALDEQMKPETRDIATAMGLRGWLT